MTFQTSSWMIAGVLLISMSFVGCGTRLAPSSDTYVDQGPPFDHGDQIDAGLLHDNGLRDADQIEQADAVTIRDQVDGSPCLGALRTCFPRAVAPTPRIEIGSVFPNDTGAFLSYGTVSSLSVTLPRPGDFWCRDDAVCVVEIGNCLIRQEPAFLTNGFVARAVGPHGFLDMTNFYSVGSSIALPGESVQFSMLMGYGYGEFSVNLRMGETTRWIAPVPYFMAGSRAHYVDHRRGEPIDLQWAPVGGGAMVVQIHNVTTMHATARAKCYFDPRRGAGSIPIEVIDSVSPIPNVPRVLGASIVAEEQIINANGIQSIISAPNYVLGAIIREVD